MTPLNYTHLQEFGFTLLIPIVSRNKTANDEALTMWGKEIENRVIRLELHKAANAKEDSSLQQGPAPFYPEGLKVFTGEKNSPELQYEATIFYTEELAAFLTPES